MSDMIDSEKDNTQKTVLIIEDDKFLQNIINKHLTNAGYNVITVETGEDALKSVAQTRPDLIIADIVLSGISGLDVLDRLAQNSTTNTIPFIIFTNSDETSSVERGKKLGAVKYLVKALSTPDRMVREVNEFFGRVDT